MNNVFVNDELFYTHFQLAGRKRRIDDFFELYNKLKNHLKPKEELSINKADLKKWIAAHQPENREVVERLIKTLRYITFNDFYGELKKQIKTFNRQIKGKRYILVLGAGNDAGGVVTEFNINKSNLWTILLSYKYLETKPYDIIFNLNVAIKLYYPTIKEFVIMDDASYSGNQLVENILKISATELLYWGKNLFVTSKQSNLIAFRPISIDDKQINVHIVCPFFSQKAYYKLCNADLVTGINYRRYVSYIIRSFAEVIDPSDIEKLDTLYSKFINFVKIGDLIPLYFEHKIADELSTISLVLIKGQVLDDPNKRIIFINACKYDPLNPDKFDLNPDKPFYLQKKLYCPIPPYINFSKLMLS